VNNSSNREITSKFNTISCPESNLHNKENSKDLNNNNYLINKIKDSPIVNLIDLDHKNGNHVIKHGENNHKDPYPSRLYFNTELKKNVNLNYGLHHQEDSSYKLTSKEYLLTNKTNVSNKKFKENLNGNYTHFNPTYLNEDSNLNSTSLKDKINLSTKFPNLKNNIYFSNNGNRYATIDVKASIEDIDVNKILKLKSPQKINYYKYNNNNKDNLTTNSENLISIKFKHENADKDFLIKNGYANNIHTYEKLSNIIQENLTHKENVNISKEGTKYYLGGDKAEDKNNNMNIRNEYNLNEIKSNKLQKETQIRKENLYSLERRNYNKHIFSKSLDKGILKNKYSIKPISKNFFF